MRYTRAIVLRKTISGEADLFILAFTENFGKLRIFAKGAKKISAKLAPHLDALNIGEIGFVEGRQFLRLTESITLNYLKNTKSDLGRLASAFFVAELIGDLILEGAPAAREFEEAERILLKIDSVADSKVCYLPYIFAARFLSLLGYHPELDKKTNEDKLLRICLEYGYDAVDKIDLSPVKIAKLRFAVQAMLARVLRGEINSWKFLEKSDII